MPHECAGDDGLGQGHAGLACRRARRFSLPGVMLAFTKT